MASTSTPASSSSRFAPPLRQILSKDGTTKPGGAHFNGFRDVSVDGESSLLDPKNTLRILSPTATGVLPRDNVIRLTKMAFEEIGVRRQEKKQLDSLVADSRRALAETKRKIELQKQKIRMLSSETIRYENETKRVEDEMGLLHRESTGLERLNRKTASEAKQLVADNNSILIALYEATKTKREAEDNVQEARKAYFAEADARRMMTQSFRLYAVRNASYAERLARAHRQRYQLNAAILGAAGVQT
ncbi:unnamed protein product [Amoebophrya sp. A120]|nr:unnamed protein product [Amoebophrya sp. A120]|eukprot:GSA120T00017524001.1